MKVAEIHGLLIGVGQPKIIVPLLAGNAAEVLGDVKELEDSECDMIEWRLDYFTDPLDANQINQLAREIKKVTAKPLIMALRSQREGGVKNFSGQEYLDFYLELLEQPAFELIDVEIFMPEVPVERIVAKAHQQHVSVIMSNHDFRRTSSKKTLVAMLTSMAEKRADICKIAVMPRSSQDVLTLLAATNEAKKLIDCPLITIALGKLGFVSRFTGEIFGSAATYAAGKKVSDPGQIAAENLKELLTSVSLK
ncbi:type I 3-dehydroquinate dehydratase [Enterococcus sp. LJL90]